MLNEETAKELGYKREFRHAIQKLSFVKEGPLWVKAKCDTPLDPGILTRLHVHSYSKYGKTMGFQTKRFIEYNDPILLYFNDEDDKQYKGYCLVENLYMYYLPVKSQSLMHLTNGIICSQFYFNSDGFYQQVSRQLLKQVVQLNFYEKFSLVELLGKGTYSKVYLAKNKETQQKYAVKIVGKKDKNNSCTKSIVEEEKKILALLDSQYICRMEQFYQQDETYIFVLELLQGQDLMTIFRDKVQINLSDLVMIFTKVLEGLAHIHSKNILHRDLKPQNIMIDAKTMTPKLIDFGLSLLCGPKVDKKRFKRCGTMGYMAYEVINNTSDKKKMYDEKCDMFSFGIIAHMMLMGVNPLKGANYNETVKKNQQCNIQLNREQILFKYGQKGLQFLSRLLKKSANDRWSAKQALQSEFIKQDFMNDHSILKTHLQEPTQQKEEEAQFQNEDEPVSIPQFQNFVHNKTNFDPENGYSN